MTAAKRESALLQWHAKSSSDGQPSVDNGVRKQFRAQDGMSESWAEATEARAMKAATVKDFMLIDELMLGS